MSEQQSERVTVKQAAEIAGVSVRTIEKWIAKGALTTLRVPGARKLWLLRAQVTPQTEVDRRSPGNRNFP
ncbi:MAG: helix-turn-helix domain-containing protein [Acidobacteriota bacterium]|nr:helix-turn-helix domain-containing protein [Acidobacteriota bacterium]